MTSGLPPAGATPLLAMEHRVRTRAGAEAYAKRSCTVEPVFGDCKENRGFRGFMRRGLPAVHRMAAVSPSVLSTMAALRHPGGDR